jgi:hypothetical protein
MAVLVGNFGFEVSEHINSIPQRLAGIFKEWEQEIAGELPPSTVGDDMAGLILAAMHGAILPSKAEQSLVPMERLSAELQPKRGK